MIHFRKKGKRKMIQLDTSNFDQMEKDKAIELAKTLGAKWSLHFQDDKDWYKFKDIMKSEKLEKPINVGFDELFQNISKRVSYSPFSYTIEADIQSIYKTPKGTLICNLIANYEKNTPVLRVVLGKDIPSLTKEELENKRVEVEGELDLYRPSAQLQLKAKSINILGDCSRLVKIAEWEKEYEDILLSDEEAKKGLEDFYFSDVEPITDIGLIAGKKSNNGYKDFMKEINKFNEPDTNPKFLIYTPQDTPEGTMTAEYMAAAIKEFNEKANCQCICIVRGGGDPEQLIAFSNPLLLCAIDESKIPVITGVGHSDDKLLCKRVKSAYDAGTPTGAAKKLIDGIKKLQANKSQVKSNYFPKKTYNNKDSAYLAEWDAIIAEKDAKIRELEQEIERLKKKDIDGLWGLILSKLKR